MARIVICAGLIAVLLGGCQEPVTPSPPDIRPVRSVTVERRPGLEHFSSTGQVRAQEEVNIAFRLDGRVLERRVGVGDTVRAGQIVARLDPQNQANALRSARAMMFAAQGQLTQARNTFERQQELMGRGYTTRAQFDQSQQAFQTAQAQAESAQAQLRQAEDMLGYTELYADADGTVIDKGAEPGEVVRAGQMIVKVARQGVRDAVFDIPAQLMRATSLRDHLVEVALTDDPRVKTTGRAREVAPQADPTTRTFQVRIGLTRPPEAMRLGAVVTGRIQVAGAPSVELPASALLQAQGQPAVWVFDPASHTVALRTVDVLRYERASVVIGEGLETGEVIVTAGVQALRPGQKVRLLGGRNS